MWVTLSQQHRQRCHQCCIWCLTSMMSSRTAFDAIQLNLRSCRWVEASHSHVDIARALHCVLPPSPNIGAVDSFHIRLTRNQSQRQSRSFLLWRRKTWADGLGNTMRMAPRLCTELACNCIAFLHEPLFTLSCDLLIYPKPDRLARGSGSFLFPLFVLVSPYFRRLVLASYSCSIFRLGHPTGPMSGPEAGCPRHLVAPLQGSRGDHLWGGAEPWPCTETWRAASRSCCNTTCVLLRVSAGRLGGFKGVFRGRSLSLPSQQGSQGKATGTIVRRAASMSGVWDPGA